MNCFKLAFLLLFLWVSPAWAAISFIGGAVGSSIDGADATVTLPGGMVQGDLVIFSSNMGVNSNRDMVMTTSGYTEIADLFSDDTIDTNLGVFYKFMGATPDTTAVGTGNGDASTAMAAAVLVFRGVDRTVPFDVASTTSTGATPPNTAIPDAPSINHNNPTGVWVVISVASGTGTGATCAGGTKTYTFPTGYTVNPQQKCIEDTNGDPIVGMGYKTSPADPEDPAVMTINFTDAATFSNASVTMALRPASGGPLIDRTPVGDLTNGRLVQ